MFSSRTKWDLSPNRLSKLIADKLSHNESIVYLTESNPTRCGFIYPEKEILSDLADKTVLLYQAEPRGLISARVAVAEYYESRSIPISPEQIILTASTSEAYSYLFKLLCDAGNEIIVPQPSYPLFDYLCQLNDVRVRYYHLLYDGEWRLDLDSLQSQFTNQTRAVILVHPNNPTGSYLKQKEFEQICILAEKNNCAIITDEVFEPYAFFQDDHRADILKSSSTAPIFLLNGISKLFGLPQLKLSWIIVKGNFQQTTEVLNRLDIIADMFLSVNQITQIALPNLFKHSPDITSQIRHRIQTNYKILKNIFSGSTASVFHIEGGWYAILQLPQAISDENWAYKILTDQNIVVHPGHFFDLEQKSCIILSLLVKSELFENCLKRIVQTIER